MQSLEDSSTQGDIGLEGLQSSIYHNQSFQWSFPMDGVGGEVFKPGAWVFLFHNTLWCYVWFAFLVFISFIFYIFMLVQCSVVSLYGNLLINLHVDYIVQFSVKINLAIKLCVKGPKYCAKVYLAYFILNEPHSFVYTRSLLIRMSWEKHPKKKILESILTTMNIRREEKGARFISLKVKILL